MHLLYLQREISLYRESEIMTALAQKYLCCLIMHNKNTSTESYVVLQTFWWTVGFLLDNLHASYCFQNFTEEIPQDSDHLQKFTHYQEQKNSRNGSDLPIISMTTAT